MDVLIFLELINKLHIADAQTIGDIIVVTRQANWTPGQSATVQAQKILNQLALTNQIEKCRGFYRIFGCKSTYDTHAKKLTHDLSSFLKKYPQTVIFREHTIEEVGLRPDALLLIIKQKEGGGGLCARCVIYECVINETPEYLTKKRNAWNSWQGALPFLTQLFKTNIPSFTFLTSDDLNRFMEES